MSELWAHLLARATIVEQRVRALVAARRSDDPAPDDPFRGLYLSEEVVARLLESSFQEARGLQPADLVAMARQVDAQFPDAPLCRLAAAAGLTELDVTLLVIAVVPDLDTRFEKLYGYLNDDVTRRRATVGLALELAGGSPLSAADRARFSPGSPLSRMGLLFIEDTDRPLLSRSLKVPDRVTAHLLGDSTADAALDGMTSAPVAHPGAGGVRLGEAMRAGARLAYVREPHPGLGAATGVAALRHLNRPSLVLDLTRVGQGDGAVASVAVAAREALLAGCGVVASPVDALAERSLDALRDLTALPLPVVLAGPCTWDPRWSACTPLLFDAEQLLPAARTALWRQNLDGVAEEAVTATSHFVLGPAQIGRAVEAARAAALLHGADPTGEDLRRGARAQNAAGLERLARRIEPSVSWDDLVLPEPALAQLRDVTSRARYRDLVLAEWRMRRGGGRGKGVVALFAGDSGTGKTMSAEVIAADLGLDLYAVNLATVVDKYVGETEKNLERIFSEAGGVNAVLLFDEADAIFGKRSEVRDAHDRYANIESAYLLQRMETFDGLAILSTNLRSNIDDAFTRRLDAIIDFPAPSAEMRLALWERCLAAPLPRADDIDLAFISRAFELSGGNIRSAATSAAYAAAASDGAVGMREIIGAVRQEYRKLGRLVHEREFGAYLSLVP